MGKFFIGRLPLIHQNLKVGIRHPVVHVGNGSVEEFPAGFKEWLLVGLVAGKKGGCVLNLAKAATAFLHIVQLRENFGQNDDRVELTLRLVQSTSSPKNGTENEEIRVKTRVKTRVKIKEMMRVNPKVTIPEMASEIGVSVKTIEWHLAKMKGIEIEREGPANGGHWILLKP